LDKKTTIGITFILFLVATWLIGNMMSFQYAAGRQDVDLPSLGVIVALVPLVMVGIIFYQGRTRMFLFLFSFALFWIIAPIFFHVLGALYFGLIFLGLFLLFLAFKMGYIDSKKVAAMTGFFIALGGFIFWVYSDLLADALYGHFPSAPITAEDFGEGFTYVWDRTGAAAESAGGPGILMLAVIVISALGFFVYQKLEPMRSDPGKREDEEKMESDISSTVDRALTELHQGKDIESTILRCYQRMCLILEKKGVENEDFMTPREFENVAAEKLNVSSSNISDIREIFELAKYSSHQLGDEEKERVVKDLKALRDELGGIRS